MSDELTRLRLLSKSAEHLQGIANRRVAELQQKRFERLLAGDPFHVIRGLDGEIDEQRHRHSVEGHRLAAIKNRLAELEVEASVPSDLPTAERTLAALRVRYADLTKPRGVSDPSSAA